MTAPFELPMLQIRTSIGRVLAECVHGDDTDLSLRQIAILFALHEMPNVSVRPLAIRLGLNNPAVTRGIDRLVALGFVTRWDDPNDRRRVQLNLTQEAVDYTARVTARLEAELRCAAGGQEAHHAV